MIDKNKVKKLRNQGLSYGSIAKLFNVSRARIHQICSGYSSEKIKEYKLKILLRDNYKCQWGETCKEKNVMDKDLIIHHIDFNNENNNFNNLITLCKWCHSKFHSQNNIDEKIEKILKNKKSKIKKNRIKLICQQCGKEFKVFPCRKNAKFCSPECCGKSFKKSFKGRKFSDKWRKKLSKKKKMYWKNKKKVINSCVKKQCMV